MAEDLLPLLGINIEENESDSEDDSNDSEHEAGDLAEDIAPVEKKKESKKEKKSSVAHPMKQTFDKSLPGTHSYLGDDLEDISGRTIHDDDSLVILPLLALPGIVLIPGVTIPLHLFQHRMVAMIKTIAENDRTFGIIDYRYQTDDSNTTLANLGTTAEIYSIKYETDEVTGNSTVRVKAKGRQRFKIIETRREITGILVGKVRILPECVLPDSLDGARPPSHSKFCCSPLDQDMVVKTAVDRCGNTLTSVSMVINRQLDKFSPANLTWWPPWVYRMYDSKVLSDKIIEELQSWNDTLKTESFPRDPLELSYWVAQNLPLDDSMRLHLLSLNSKEQRLRCELDIMKKCTMLLCKDCGFQIANKTDVFSMSEEGLLGAFVNPGGYVHETLTVHSAHNLSLVGRPSTEHSWFPGYAWTIAQCKNCMSHMGWRFTATDRKMRPQKFWGLCRGSLITGIKNADENEEWTPIM